jgi:hypothetical protein
VAASTSASESPPVSGAARPSAGVGVVDITPVDKDFHVPRARH